MSTIIMSQCWPLDGMSIAQKAVLISLADNANDQGVCWPSIPTIAKRVCAGSERTVEAAIKWLESVKIVKAERVKGRSTRYTIIPDAYQPPQDMRPRKKCATANNAPPQEMRHTPAADAGDPRSNCAEPPQQMRPNRNEPPANRQGTASDAGDAGESVSSGSRSAEEVGDEKPLTAKDLVAEGIPRQVALDWLVVRKGKGRKSLTPTAWAAVKREAEKAGWAVADAVEYAVNSEWAGFRAEWLMSAREQQGKGQGSAHSGFNNRDYGTGGRL